MQDARKDEPTSRDGIDLMPSWREVFLYFLKLGFINIGGPVAQITMMYNHMVERRQWLSNDRFVRIMAFCHMVALGSITGGILYALAKGLWPSL